MALTKFRASPLPNPPAQYDPQYLRQLIRVIETYFSQLDSNTFNGIAATKQVTTAEKNALTPSAGWVVFDTTLDKLCVYSGSAWETVTSV
jgi:hypothetical protein